MDFLKQKITSLNKKKEEPQKIAKVAFEMLDEASMHPQLSHQSSAGSFMKEKQMIEEKGVQNVDLTDLVGETVKLVSVNLEKIADQRKKHF